MGRWLRIFRCSCVVRMWPNKSLHPTANRARLCLGFTGRKILRCSMVASAAVELYVLSKKTSMSFLSRTFALGALAAGSLLFVLPFRSDVVVATLVVTFFAALCLLGVKCSRSLSVSVSLTVLVSVVISNLWHYCWMMMGWWGGFGWLSTLVAADGELSYDWRLLEMFLAVGSVIAATLIFRQIRMMRQLKREQVVAPQSTTRSVV